MIYDDHERRREFYMWPSERKQAMLDAPKELSVEDIRKLAPNLALGLAKLGFQHYSISKKGESQYVSAGLLRGEHLDRSR